MTRNETKRGWRRSGWSLAFLLLGTVPAAGVPGAAPEVPAAEGASQNVDPRLAEAWRLLQQGQYVEAASAFERANEAAGGRCGPCLLGLASAQALSRQLDAALSTVRRTIEMVEDGPLRTRAYAQLGALLVQIDRLAHGLAPDSAAPRPQSKELAEAIDALEKALAGGYPGRMGMMQNLALARLFRGEYAAAAAAARQSLALDPHLVGEVVGRWTLCRARHAGKLPAPDTAADPVSPAAGTAGQVSPPKGVYVPPPPYPKLAGSPRIQGSVVIEAIIDQDGCVINPRVVKSLASELDQAALDQIATWAFRPAERDGKPVKVFYTLTVNFANPPPGTPLSGPDPTGGLPQP